MGYRRLKPIDIVRLAAPHTWAASAFPAIFGGAVYFEASARAIPESFISFLLCFAAAVLMQSAVNALNDYRDFVSGTDTAENSDDPTDAVLVYNNISPVSVRNLGILFLLLAGACGIGGIGLSALLQPLYPLRGIIAPLAVGVCGALVIALYSFGPKPISYLPLGELFSGAVMGLGIPAGVFSALAGRLPWQLFILSIPFVLGIGLIMMTNNACDIERDSQTGRCTLTVLLGRRHSRIVYRALVIIWYVTIPILIALFAAQARDHMYLRLTVAYALLLACLPLIIRLVRLPLTPETRANGMKSITLSNAALGAAYILGVMILSSLNVF
jgi:1,4-dihydroxy-2-naphthoate octaprenyltransferase